MDDNSLHERFRRAATTRAAGWRRRLRGVHLDGVSNPFVDRLGPRRLRRVPGRRELSLDSSSAVARSSELAATAADAASDDLSRKRSPPRTRPGRDRTAGRTSAAASDGLEAAALSRRHRVGGKLRGQGGGEAAARRRSREASRPRARASRRIARLGAGRGHGEGEEIAARRGRRLRLASRARVGRQSRRRARASTRHRRGEQRVERRRRRSAELEHRRRPPRRRRSGRGDPPVDEAPETQDVLSSVNARHLRAKRRRRRRTRRSVPHRVVVSQVGFVFGLFGDASDRAKQPPAAGPAEIGKCSLRSEGCGAVPGAGVARRIYARRASRVASPRGSITFRRGTGPCPGRPWPHVGVEPRPAEETTCYAANANKEPAVVLRARRATEATDPSSTGGGEAGTRARRRRRALAAADAAIDS